MSRKEQRKETSINFKIENIALEFCSKRVNEIVDLMVIHFIPVGPTEGFRGSGSWLLPSQEQRVQPQTLRRWLHWLAPARMDAWGLRRHHTTPSLCTLPVTCELMNIDISCWCEGPWRELSQGLSVEIITQHEKRVSVCLFLALAWLLAVKQGEQKCDSCGNLSLQKGQSSVTLLC